MTYDEVEPFIQHWVEVTMIGESTPRFRGVLSWAGGTIAVFIGGAPPEWDGDPGIPLPSRMSVTIHKIKEISQLPDPPWLQERNKAAAVLRAEALLRSNQGLS